jgi:hypothetical protein
VGLEVPSHFGCNVCAENWQVGDRYFTDIVFGNNNGLLTIRPAPLTSVGEPFIVQKVLHPLLFMWKHIGMLSIRLAYFRVQLTTHYRLPFPLC